MIVFDLRCAPAAHIFEAWFGSSADYEDQRARGLVSCPICGSGDIAKAPMAPAVPRKGGGGMPVALPAEDAAKMKAMLPELATLQRRMLKGSEWVGDRFASEARAIHVGDAEARQIHGEATPAQVDSLIEDGVPVAPLLIPVAPPDQEN
jgi:hypothetical protein